MGSNKEKSKSKKVFTVMFMPNKGGKSKVMQLTKIKISFLVSGLILVVLFSFLFLYFTYISRKENSQLIAYNESVTKALEEINGKLGELEELNEKLVNENTEYLEKNKEMINELTTYKGYEEQLRVLLNDESIRERLSKSGESASYDLQETIELGILKIDEIIKVLEEEVEELNKIPDILPCTGAIASYFGGRIHPVYQTYKVHEGIDISGYEGQSIYASADGIVEYAGWMSGYGKLVVIDHRNGYKTYYAHNSELLVHEGQEVQKREEIALMGSTGVSTGTHCHFEVIYEGQPIDPLILIEGGE